MLATMKLKHVQRIKAPEAKGGGVYYYFRPTGQKFAAAFGTPEFAAEWQRFMDKLQQIPADRPGTLGALIALYRAAPEFRLLADDTKISYQRAFNAVQKVHDCPLVEIDAPLVLGFRDRVFAKNGRWMANYVVTVLSGLFVWALPHGHVATNPAAAVPKIRRSRKAKIANRPWRPAEFRLVATRASLPVRTALFLGRHAMLRITDAILVDWREYDGRTIKMTLSKNGREIETMATEPLRRQLEAMRHYVTTRRKLARAAILEGPIVRSSLGRGYTRSGLQSVLYRLIAKLEKQGLVAPGLTFHGLRKGTATVMAEELHMDEHRIGAAMGETAEATRVYTAPANRKRLSRSAFTVLESQLAGEEKQLRNEAKTQNCKTNATSTVKQRKSRKPKQ